MAETFSRSLTCNLECQEATSVRVSLSEAMDIFRMGVGGIYCYTFHCDFGTVLFFSFSGITLPLAPVRAIFVQERDECEKKYCKKAQDESGES